MPSTQVAVCRLPDVDARVGHDDAVVVIDALRASATIATLLDVGAASVRPVTDREEIDDESAYLTVGEDHGERLPGFDLDNSPLNVRRAADDVAGRPVAIRTTNGTKCVAAVSHAGSVLVGSLVNASALVDYCADRLDVDDLWLVPARRHGSFAPEDLYAALHLSEAFEDAGLPVETDLGAEARSLRARDPAPVFHESDTGAYLADLGKREDVSHCATPDVCTAVPLLKEHAFVDASV